MFEGFKLKYRLNAKHSLSNDAKNIHPHTFEISLLFEQLQLEKKVDLYSIDRIIENFLLLYQNKYLNDISPFNQLEPSIENMGNVFYEEFKVILHNEQLNLIQLEISETPLRVYLVSDRLMFSSIKLK
ncbi:6-carboxytetrahydropterin synthase [Ruminiclostridium herbifermentans]|uniref:6-carboxy-5,6,7,8-tetrahydropterin synthase n=1 Tax=Ruminiclostridium herbifermentans TaxID=2488810 RepID=A0A4U7J8J2_9FIRM|nr:6-carboxytetrahydropterin synthase [Ruminiclostridium herbifermentans]QNU66956.1 6-carboxytetrahydropterin synthase [Ruminiclostridium herbifermentans]